MSGELANRQLVKENLRTVRFNFSSGPDGQYLRLKAPDARRRVSSGCRCNQEPPRPESHDVDLRLSQGGRHAHPHAYA